ncbi:MAG: hypothetical protein C4576_01290 [Desulfobacteraceae bacterium]|nr:MAG: hypothetical protein C4576_01290 [Desulfobacteraceae bacterium]
MKLSQVRLRNFRCYRDETSIDFTDLTALVGRNDSGKSTVMEALDIFFNDGTPDKHDASKHGHPSDVSIICVFEDLPDQLVLDDAEFTSLGAEYLLNRSGQLEVHKVFNGALEKPKLTALNLVATHPTADKVADIMALTNADLKKRAAEVGADTTGIDKKVNAQLREAIRRKIGDLALDEISLSLVKDGKATKVWSGIQAVMPAFALFKSDRASTDQDSEAQDPLNAAIKEAVKQKEAELNAISDHIAQEVKKIADMTVRKLQEMDPGLATTLSPQFPTPKWAGLFKASITGDGDIPINKRGSGVRRLILLNFFRAKAEQLMNDNNRQNAIFAIEEPETSQHPRNQRLLISALQDLAGRDQVIVTTHTPMLTRTLPATSIRFIHTEPDGRRLVQTGGSEETNQLIANSLGVLPDHTVKLFVCVEGKTDIPFLKNIARILIDGGHDVPDLEQMELDGEIIFAPLGGSQLAIWCNRLANLNRPEFHLYDRDTAPPQPPRYQCHIDAVNRRVSCKACCTSKREIENYIHYEAINQALSDNGIAFAFPGPFGEHDDIPNLLSSVLNPISPPGDRWGERRAKEFLCGIAVKKMTNNMLLEVDPNREVLGWFSEIKQLLNP